MGVNIINSLLSIDAQEVVTSLGENNDVPIDSTCIRIVVSNNSDSITGFQPSSITAGGLLFIVNVNNINNLILKHDDASSTDGNRIFLPSGTTLTINPYSHVLLRYVEITGRTGWWLFREALTSVAAKVGRATDHNVNTATPTIIGWDDEEFDTADMHDNSVSNTRITIPFDAPYHVGSTLKFSGNSAKVVVELFLNGSLASVMSDLTMDSGGEPTVTVDGIWELAAGDYIEVRVTQNSGSAKDLKTGSSFWAYKIN